MPSHVGHRSDLEATRPLVELLDPATRFVAERLPDFLWRGIGGGIPHKTIVDIFVDVLGRPVYKSCQPDEALAIFISDLQLELERHGLNQQMVSSLWATAQELKALPAVN